MLEGRTWPDVYLETDQIIIVIEGKRDERGPMTSTTWMRTRHQMLRHLDCAWERRDGRDLVGFFIVEGNDASGGVPAVWREAVALTVSSDTLTGSLPHRGYEERQALAACFLGATTWQSMCHAFNIPWAACRIAACEPTDEPAPNKCLEWTCLQRCSFGNWGEEFAYPSVETGAAGEAQGVGSSHHPK